VRGHRVELGRVERVLSEHPEVREAAVVVRGEPPDDIRLVAYVVGREGASLTSSGLRRFLLSRLPAHMVPGIFIQLSALPMTPAGKLDRRGLPKPSVEKLPIENRYVEPRNDLERKLAMAWSEILEVPRVGIHDRFLDLGGHSLLAGQIIARMSEVCKYEISHREFFDHPTVAELAELLSRNVRQDIGDKELAGMLADVESASDEEALEAVKKGS
jgi:hypothetical protein